MREKIFRMKRMLLHKIAPLYLIMLSLPSLVSAQAQSPRQELIADAGWKFFLGDPAGAEAESFDDSSWRSMDLPHDWSIETAPEAKNPTGRAADTFLPVSVVSKDIHRSCRLEGQEGQC